MHFVVKLVLSSEEYIYRTYNELRFDVQICARNFLRY